MKKEIINRSIMEGEHIVKTGATIRETAKKFNVSKSTVHKDISNRLKDISPILYSKIQVIIKKHIDNRHIKGGESTRKKYKLNMS